MSLTMFAPERISIQCHLWRCEKPEQPYCSDSHQQLAVSGEEGVHAIIFIDGKKDPEIFLISRKIVRSKMLGKHCGVPHVAAENLCTNPWEVWEAIFYRDLEFEETRRSWLFISEKDPEGFGTIWQAVGRPISLPGECVCHKYWLQSKYIRESGSFRLKRITGGDERFSKAVYWLSFQGQSKMDDEGEVTGASSSEGKPAKRQHMVGNDTPLLPKVLQMNRNDNRGGESTSVKLNQCMVGYGKLVRTLDGSFVLVNEKVQTVPVTPMEAMLSHLMGIFKKGRAKKLEEACPEFLKEMLELCDNRMVLFDNKTKDKRMQVQKILSLVDSIASSCNGKPITDELFHELQVQTVPMTPMEAMISHLMGIFEGRAKKLEEARPEFLKEVPKLCDNRMVLFDNTTKEDKRRKAEQVQKLLSLFDSISGKCNGKPFTDELFHELQVQTVPMTPMEAIISHLMGIFVKGRAKKLEEACPEILKEMPELCDNRMVLFDNKTKEDKGKKAEQVHKLV